MNKPHPPTSRIPWIFFVVAVFAIVTNVLQAGEPSASELEIPAVDSYPDDLLEAGMDPTNRNCGIVLTAPVDYPRLILNTTGPTATVRTLAFSPDSTRVYAGSLDKTVHVWGFRTGARGVRRSTGNAVIPVQSLHWEITRGPRGSVYAIAASPVSRELAIAGYSARDATGDIVLYDTARNTVERSLHGHLQAVSYVEYSPDGKFLASITRDGEIRVWSADRDWQGTLLRGNSGVSTQFQPIRFLDNKTLAVTQPTDATGNAWQIALYDVTAETPAPKVLPQPHTRRVTSLAATRTPGVWASADWDGNVYVWTGIANSRPKLLRKDSMALCMDFGPDQRLYVATARSDAKGDRPAGSSLEIWDPVAVQLLDNVRTATNEHNFVCAVSPDGSRVVTYAGDETQLLVYLLKDRETVIEKPLAKAPLRLRGSGEKRYHVAFEEGSYRIGFRSRPGSQVEQVFDPSDPKVVEVDPATLTWRDKNADAFGWELRVAGDNRSKLLLNSGGQAKGTITLDPTVHGNVRTYCWLAREGKAYGIALGTDTQNGVFVYGLAETAECPMLRYFRDHTDFVTALSVTTDGKYLASSSGDQTVKIWSLEGIDAATTTFTKAPGWGAVFAIEEGKVVLSSVLPAGTAARKGLRNGDVIAEAKFGPVVAQKIGKGNEVFATTDPREILDALQQCPLTENVLLTVDRLGYRLNQRVLLVPAWEPLLTLFVSQNNEWSLWTPQGYYDSSVDGDELFGWLLNKGVSRKAEFFRADQFRLELEHPELIRKVLALGSVPAALREAGVPAPEDLNRVADAAVREKPVVTILNPVDGQEFDHDVIRVRAMVEFPNSQSADRVQGNAFVNGVQGKVVDSSLAGLQRTYEWNMPSSNVYNRLRVVAEDIAPERMVNFSDVHFRIKPDNLPTGNPRLHLITLAATDYRHVPKLEFSITDAKAIVDTLREKTGQFYDLGRVVSLHNEAATRSGFYEMVQDLVTSLEETRPDDLMVLFLAGHGIAVDGEYYFVPVDAKKENLKEVGISWSDLRRLALIPCRKLVLLDTCHSGSVIPLREAGSANLKAAIRPLSMDEFLVFSATDVGQEALEFGEHGVFTQCILDALGGQAAIDGGDAVYLNQVIRYVENEVPRRTAKLQLQTPKSSPPGLFDVISIPLATVTR